MIEFSIAGEVPSTPNLREHWAAKAKRTKAQRSAVARKMPAWSDGPLLIVRLTRVAPRSLDTDNLAAALKGHRDAVAARLRVDDASPLVRWEYHQAKGAPAVVVNAWRAGDQAPEYLRGTQVSGTIRATRLHGDDRRPKAGDAARARAEAKDRARAEEYGVAYDPDLPPAVKDAEVTIRTRLGTPVRKPAPGYTPPRSTPVDAAKEAEATFAPLGLPPCCGRYEAHGEHDAWCERAGDA